MDGMLHLAADAAANPAITRFLGILYAEDFDEPQPDAPLSEPAPPPPLTAEDVEAACVQAVARARLEWEAGAAEKRLDLLGALRAALAEAATDAESAAAATTEATVATILAVLMGALPQLCNEHGPAEVSALLHRLLPLLRTEPKITIRVHADLVATLRQEIDALQTDFTGTIAVTPAPIARGDLRVTWENGSLVRDANQIHRAMHEALCHLGLLAPLETSPKRTLAHAE